MDERLRSISSAVRDGNHQGVVDLVREALAAGEAPADVLSGGLIRGMQELGDLFKDGQAFLPEILISARAMKMGLAELQPRLVGQAPPSRGTVILGTVEGDLHDIGKNLVGMLLGGNGFAVVDLGVDVSAERFVAAAREHGADIVALSALLTTTAPQFRRVIEALEAAGERAAVKVLVGGAPVSAALAREIGADGQADDCIAAVDEAARLVAARAGA
jgi:5-methyltetrahydrofolate--homocysteine methyltransferase